VIHLPTKLAYVIYYGPRGELRKEASWSDGWGERQKYEWVLDENGERKYFNDVTNPGNGIYWMRWSEWLG